MEALYQEREAYAERVSSGAYSVETYKERLTSTRGPVTTKRERMRNAAFMKAWRNKRKGYRCVGKTCISNARFPAPNTLCYWCQSPLERRRRAREAEQAKLAPILTQKDRRQPKETNALLI